MYFGEVRAVTDLIRQNLSIGKWASVGLLTNIVDYLIFIYIYSRIESVVISNLLSGLISITFNYLAHYHWSFKSGNNHTKTTARYLINLIIFWSLSTISIKILINLAIDPRLAKLIPTLFIAPLSYLSLRFIVFK